MNRTLARYLVFLIVAVICVVCSKHLITVQEPVAEHRIWLPIIINHYPPAPPSKRWGLCADPHCCEDLMKFDIGRFMNWGPKNPCPDVIVDFVPMAWRLYPNVIPAFEPGSTLVLGPNEPNYQWQAVASPEDVAAMWWQMEEGVAGTGILIASPAVAACTPDSDSKCLMDGKEWMDKFMSACSGCQIDIIATHWYGGEPANLSSWLNKMSQYGRPIILTEFGCTWYGTAQRLQCMREIMSIVEEMTEGYGWFALRLDPNIIDPWTYSIWGMNSLINYQTGEKTEFGEIYAGN